MRGVSLRAGLVDLFLYSLRVDRHSALATPLISPLQLSFLLFLVPARTISYPLINSAGTQRKREKESSFFLIFLPPAQESIGWRLQENKEKKDRDL